jgi:hypothetical protein
MAELDGMKWFKQQFGPVITPALQGTPFSLDMATAIAVQETYGDCWGRLYQTKTVADVLKLCVGDTLDYPNRDAFPKNKADLVQTAVGQQMFPIAHQALLNIAQYNSSYAGAAKNPDKFCHGYGIFQYDIQFLQSDSSFCLQYGWYDFGQCLTRLVKELNAALKRAYGSNKTSLTDDEMMYVAIAYNAGHVVVGGGPKQGYKDGGGVYYGQYFQKFLAMAHTVTATPAPAPAPGLAMPMAAMAAVGTGSGPAAKKATKPGRGKKAAKVTSRRRPSKRKRSSVKAVKSVKRAAKTGSKKAKRARKTRSARK